MNQKEILAQVEFERSRQNTKWGEQNHIPYKWLAILSEEVGEASKAALDGSLSHYRKEMIQVAAVAVAAIESLDRGKWRGSAEPERRG